MRRIALVGLAVAVLAGLAPAVGSAAEATLSDGCETLNELTYDGFYKSAHSDRDSEIYMFFHEGEVVTIAAGAPPILEDAELILYATEAQDFRTPYPGAASHRVPYSGGYGFAWDVRTSGGESVAVTWDVSCGWPGTFVDDDGHTFEDDIEWIASEGITKGCNPPTNDRYCPDDPVTRGQMAAFLVRAMGYTDTGDGDLFVDDDGTTFENDIDKLATAGVTKGCNPPINDRYCPDDFVTRGQMAGFLRRALDQ